MVSIPSLPDKLLEQIAQNCPRRPCSTWFWSVIVNTRVFYPGQLQYSRFGNFLDAFPKLKSLVVHVTTIDCTMDHEHPADCYGDAVACKLYDTQRGTWWRSRHHPGTPIPHMSVDTFLSKFRGVARKLENFEILVHQTQTGGRHWGIMQLLPSSGLRPLKEFTRFKTLHLPWIAMRHMNIPRFAAEHVLPRSTERLIVGNPLCATRFWFLQAVQAKQRCFTGLKAIKLWVDDAYSASHESKKGYEYLQCTQEDLESVGVTVKFKTIPKNNGFTA
ncbi:hypothetical protein BU23DRAFT_600533 [Bimuria novae-zelandiae CBS 107.79]|uniref:Uncharacterized protein n=1 Tax=Bimuria novae-zelandiae CBS 107.79 TaxID=1447943 RepID=A0A6A5V7I3_9PLEO|nr:hypothetical protein BU23DRAFT_600533 [Bimuria novae-zelandiae CBS 107.79]